MTGMSCLLKSLPLALTSLVAVTFAAAGGSGDWSRWRGPQDNGCAAPGHYPVTWSPTNHLLWQAPLPGKGCSTPAVWKRRIYLTAPSQGQNAVLAFDWSGRPLWQQTLGPERAGKNKAGSGSNPSPATDGRGVFVYFKSGDFAAFELDGKPRWSCNLVERYGSDTLYWDYGSSPVLTDKYVVMSMLRHGDSWLAAFDKRTGALAWKVARNYPTALEGDHSYATPLVIQQRGREALLVWGAQHLTAHAATDGHLLWDCGDFNPEAKPNWPAVASPVVCGDIAVVPYGRGDRLHGIRLGGSGDVTATHRLWTRKDTGSYTPTPAAWQGRVYLLRDAGEILCLNPATGQTLWSGTLPKNANKYYASPVLAKGRIYAAREDGVVFVLRADSSCELLAENDLAEPIIGSPVPVSDRLLLRGAKHLFCIGTK